MWKLLQSHLSSKLPCISSLGKDISSPRNGIISTLARARHFGESLSPLWLPLCYLPVGGRLAGVIPWDWANISHPMWKPRLSHGAAAWDIVFTCASWGLWSMAVWVVLTGIVPLCGPALPTATVCALLYLLDVRFDFLSWLMVQSKPEMWEPALIPPFPHFLISFLS